MVVLPSMSTVYSKACERPARLPTPRPAAAPPMVRSARLLPDWPLPLARPMPPPTTVPTLRAVELVSVVDDGIGDAPVLHARLRLCELCTQCQRQQRRRHRGACKELVCHGRLPDERRAVQPRHALGRNIIVATALSLSVRAWTIGDRAITSANRRASARARCVARLGKNAVMAQRLPVLAGSGLRETKMNALLASWQRLCSASGVLRFVDINLRGIGQVMLQNNPLTGALFLAAIAWGAFVAGAPEVLFGGVLALITATLTAMWLRVDRQALGDGLYGYNAVLVGLALPTFLAAVAAAVGLCGVGRGRVGGGHARPPPT